MDENKKENRTTDDGFFDEPPKAQNVENTGDGFFDDAPRGGAQNSAPPQGGANPNYGGYQNRNYGGNYGQRPVQRGYVPTPSRKSKGKTVGKIFAAIGIGLGVFLCGMLTTWFCLDPEIRTLIKVKKTIQKEYYQDISDGEFYDVVFDAINSDLLDPYSQYMTYDEYAAMEGSLAGNRSGIGLYFSETEENGEKQLIVYRAVENSPAERAGLQDGDRVVGYGRSETEIVKSADFNNGLKPFLDSMETNVPFCLQVQRGTETIVLSLAKEYYVESYVTYRTSDTSYGFTGADALTCAEKGRALASLPSDTAYIRLSQFTGNAVAAFDRVMAQFKADGKKNLVLDLRDNGGGYLDYLQYIAKYFCKNATDKKPLAVVADYGEKKEYYRAADNVYSDYFAEDSKITVLASSGTASASECLLGVMLDYGAIGYGDICLVERSGVAKTYGKGIMQTTFYLDAQKKDFLKLTTAELRWPVSGSSIHARGVLPEDGTKTAAENYIDEKELEGALSVLLR